MESWIVTVALSVGTFIGIYAVTKYKVEENNNHLNDLKKEIKENDKLDTKHREVINERINAAFKKTDMLTKDVTILQRDSMNHLDMDRADAKFVSKEELGLHLKNIDNELAHMNKTNEAMVGKLDDLTKALSQYMLKELNNEDS